MIFINLHELTWSKDISILLEGTSYQCLVHIKTENSRYSYQGLYHGAKPTYYYGPYSYGKFYIGSYYDKKQRTLYKNNEVNSFNETIAHCSEWRDTSITKSHVSTTCSAIYDMCGHEITNHYWEVSQLSCMAINTHKYLKLKGGSSVCGGGNLGVLYTTGRFGWSGYDGAITDASDKREGNCVVLCVK